MSLTLGPLSDGDRVVIVGGGPAGASCALALRNLAIQFGYKIDITLIEEKTFAGETHRNQCAGVLSPPLPALLEQKLNIPFPNDLIREIIRGYFLYTGNERIRLDEIDEPSVTLRRTQFDAYMLTAVKKHTIPVWTTRMTDLEFHSEGVHVFTEEGDCWADIVVGAFGLDETSGALFSRKTPYQAPRFINSVITEFYLGDDAMIRFGSYIHAFLPTHPKIEFGAITPKANHLTINIAGKNIDAEVMHSFLNSANVQAIMPDEACRKAIKENNYELFQGRFPNSLAKGYYGDRYVMVGDAAGLVRAFKGKGVTSAVLTGIRAAETIMHYGISKRAFHNHYRAANKDIISDLPFGQGMRFAIILFSRLGLMKVVIRAAKKSPELQSALFDAVSARAPYRQVLAQALSLKVVRETIK